MSLPTWAKFYYEGTKVSSEFVNVGWVLDDLALGQELGEFSEIKDWDYVEVYGERYSREKALGMANLCHIWNTVKLHVENQTKTRWTNFNTKGGLWEQKKPVRNTDDIKHVNLGLIRKIAPAMIAAEIASVQPMKSSELLSFSNVKIDTKKQTEWTKK